MTYDALKCGELDDVLGLMAEARDEERIEQGKRRMATVSKGQTPDYLPIAFSVPAPERDEYPKYNMREQFSNREVMLVSQLWGALGLLRSRSDGVPSVRPNFGVGFVPSLAGVESVIFDHTMPWPQTRLSKEDIIAMSIPDDVSGMGMMPRCLELIDFYANRIGGLVHTFAADTQGPLDVAHLIRGSDIFTDFYDDPEFVHHMLRLSVELYTRATALMLDAIGQPEGVCYHSGSLYAEGVQGRMCNDTDTLLSEAIFEEFVEPYIDEAATRGGNVWSHYCGKSPHLEAFLEKGVDGVHGVNFGNPEMQDLPAVMSALIDAGKFYYGGWPRNGESLEEYFTTILKSLGGRRAGLMLSGGPKDEEIAELGCEGVMALWHDLQDKYLDRAE